MDFRRSDVVEVSPVEKVCHHLDRVANLREHGKCMPVKVEWCPTWHCNLRCDYCFCNYVRGMHTPVMHLDEQLHVASQLIEHGVRAVLWTGGGEPTLHMHEEVCTMLHDAGVAQALVTNGWHIPGWITYSGDMFAWIRISLDTLDDGTYVKRKVGHRTRIRLPVRHVLQNAFSLTLGTSADVGIGILADVEKFNPVVWDMHVYTLSRMAYIQVRPFHARDNTVPNAKLKRIAELQDAGFRVGVSSASMRQPQPEGIPCYAQWTSPSLAPDGTLYPCCAVVGVEGYEIGNLLDNTLSEIVDNEERAAMAAQIDACCDCIAGGAVVGGGGCPDYYYRLNITIHNLLAGEDYDGSKRSEKTKHTPFL